MFDDWTGGYDLPGGGDLDIGGGFELPSAGSVFDALGKFGSFVGNVATSAVQFQNTRQTQQFERDRTKAAQDLELVKARGAIDVAREQSQLQAAIARAKLAATAGLNGFYNTLGLPSQGQGGGTGLLMIGLAAAGVYFAWRSSK